MSIEVYSDFVCPWCYIGHRRLQNALAALPRGAGKAIIWRSYQLDRDASKVPGPTAAQAMRGWYPDTDEAEARIARIIATGRDEGLDLHLHRALPVNTYDAHRLSHFANNAGLADAMRERLFRAYHTEGLNIADADVLLQLAVEVGFDRIDIRRVLETDGFGGTVRTDIDRGSRQGVSGVPYIVVDDGQPVSVLQQGLPLASILERAVQ
ncbi:DsbA family oxidoreductase [Roseinatronobacter alkalisoli]|uniref:DsbA family oxidoreductase n=1 Tax=Roseinatronobacter alkalisoli TaxID=3028235 RepID=A0ABT5TD35_9RHOB|nr:DsbA family oxidoreductase [Roseinatronobacter sp. HJB301]MDD7973035.1 DsbA family oxidoreductase [Roseinatronobacter sp. HJB301]